MKTKEELNSLRNEVEALNKKLRDLTDEELKQVIGGWQYSEYEVFLSPDEDRNEQH